MADSFRVEGIDEIQQVLDGLPDRFGAQVLTKTLRKAAKPLINEAQSLVPVDSGGLKKSLGAEQARVNGAFAGVYVGPRRGRYHGHHAHLVEFGTGPRQLDEPKLVKINGKTVKITHTGVMPAHPFMRPAFDSKYPEVLDEVRKDLQEILATGYKGVFK